jgi:hypothetical protein
LDLVLRLAEDDAKHARTFTKFFQGFAVVDFEVIAVKLE